MTGGLRSGKLSTRPSLAQGAATLPERIALPSSCCTARKMASLLSICATMGGVLPASCRNARAARSKCEKSAGGGRIEAAERKRHESRAEAAERKRRKARPEADGGKRGKNRAKEDDCEWSKDRTEKTKSGKP